MWWRINRLYDTTLEIGCLVHDLIPFLRAIGISRVESRLLKESSSPVTLEIFETGRIF